MHEEEGSHQSFGFPPLHPMMADFIYVWSNKLDGGCLFSYVY